MKEAWTAEQKAEDPVWPLYDTSLLQDLKSVDDIASKDANLVVRPLQSDDFERGYLELLKQLTSVGDVSQADFKGDFCIQNTSVINNAYFFSDRFSLMRSCQGTYYNTVIVDRKTDRVIGAASLIVERKFIHQCANVGLLFQ